MARLLLLAAPILLVTLGAIGCSGEDDLPDDEENLAASDDALSCGAKFTWKMHMNERFDTWNESRWDKFDNLPVPIFDSSHKPLPTQTCMMAKNVSIVNGMLKLATVKEPGCDGAAYTGGAIHSYPIPGTAQTGFYAGKYFRAEVSAKVSQEEGIFGAPLWFRPGSSAGASIVGGEIDVAESLGKWNNAKFATTLHPDYSDDDKKSVQFTTAYANTAKPDDGTGFHTYTMEKLPGGITFYVDGKYVGGWGCGNRKNEKKPAYFDQWFEQTPDGWSIRIDNKVGGWGGQPDATTRWGNRTALYVAYIKVWRPEP